MDIHNPVCRPPPQPYQCGRLEGTREWILEKKEHHDWRSSSGSMLSSVAGDP